MRPSPWLGARTGSWSSSHQPPDAQADVNVQIISQGDVARCEAWQAWQVCQNRQYREKAFPRDLMDAARLDGASSWRTLWGIITPNLCAPLSALGMLLFIPTWNEYFWPLIVTRKIENSVIQVGLQMFMTQEGDLWGALMAAASPGDAADLRAVHLAPAADDRRVHPVSPPLMVRAGGPLPQPLSRSRGKMSAKPIFAPRSGWGRGLPAVRFQTVLGIDAQTGRLIRYDTVRRAAEAPA